MSPGILFRDALTILLLIMVGALLFLIPWVNPPVPPADKINPPGNVIVSISWPVRMDADIDLWLIGPGMKQPVGYSRLGSRLFNLLRDDLGHIVEGEPANFELASSRGTPAGEYVVNIHCYRCLDKDLPIPVAVDVAVKADGGRLRTIAKLTVPLFRNHQERTAVRFQLDASGALTAPLSYVYKPLRELMQP